MVKINRKVLIIMLGIFFVGLVSAGVAGDLMFECSLECTRSGPKTVEIEGSGNAVFRFDAAKQELRYTLEVEKIRDVYMAHLHIGSLDAQGPIVVWLYPFRNETAAERTIAGEFSGTLADGVIRAEDLRDGMTFEYLLDSMRNGHAYINVHTRNYITGEISGLVKLGM